VSGPLCYSCRYLEADASGPDEYGNYATGFWCTHPKLVRFNPFFKLRKNRCKYYAAAVEGGGAE